MSEHAASLEPLTGGAGTNLIGSLGAPDLDAAGYVESEWRCTGTATSYRAPAGLPADGRWALEPRDRAGYRTRAVVRRPADPAAASGVLVVEWLNVSSGADAAPTYGFAAPELVRRGHTWVGVSAQWAGIVAAPALVDVGGAGGLLALQEADPERYGDLHHPGDAYCFDLFTQVATGLLGGAAAGEAVAAGPLEGLRLRRVLAVGESQSAYALTTYVNGVQPLTGRFDGFLIHSRGGPAMPLGEPGRGVDLEEGRHDPAVVVRDDLDVPVLVLETETDVLGHLDYLPARQDDGVRFRLWEVAGAAHADRSLVGDFETFLGCEDPVNRGQQRFVVRSALAHLVGWTDGGAGPPAAARLLVEGDVAEGRRGLRYRTDDVGNVLGGVRTPCVDAPVEVLSGMASPGASHVCRLFGRRAPADETVLRARYGSVQAYLDAYEGATDAAVQAGFVLADDRDEVLADAHPELITW
ncbi:alpha/beta hydrolase domain-containing protein [Dermatobacter hominis]|uniref:alpha/beta hydrolase domain-containing protein n=1 Tax=Dermatobacter hominis TaxID=2884263 RepID=UPI001D116D06|nr:alpha/beta hydrolase domain-containing protein [Dermatobacter hominis]UDY36585.1 hypothetical protein LH044_03370 [Dermatobacter hominis]